MHRIERCKVPSTRFRYANSIWVCPECQQFWVLKIVMGLYGNFKDWQALDGEE